MTRPPLDPVTLRWLADELGADAVATEGQIKMVPESPFRDRWITRHTRDAERLRRQARRLREIAEEEDDAHPRRERPDPPGDPWPRPWPRRSAWRTPMDEIDKLRALLEDAIPGPWETRPGGRVARPYMVDGALRIPGRTVCMGSERDARAIAALGTLWPSLLRVVERVEERREDFGACPLCEEAEHEEWCLVGALRERIREVLGD